MKATEQYFPVVLFIMLYKVVLPFQSLDEMLNQYQVQHASDASELRVILKRIIVSELSMFFHKFCKSCLEYEQQVNKYTVYIVQFVENQNQNWNFLFR